MTTRFRVNSPNVIHETIEGEVILIDLKTGTYYSLRDDFERAAEAGGGAVDLHLALAGKPVRIRFAGARAAEALSPAFAHLEAREDEPPALTLHVWDSGTRRAEAPEGTGASYYS